MTDGAEGSTRAVWCDVEEVGLEAASRDFAIAKGSGAADGCVEDGCAEHGALRASCEAAVGACSKLCFAEDGTSAGVFE